MLINLLLSSISIKSIILIIQHSLSIQSIYISFHELHVHFILFSIVYSLILILLYQVLLLFFIILHINPLLAFLPLVIILVDEAIIIIRRASYFNLY